METLTAFRFLEVILQEEQTILEHGNLIHLVQEVVAELMILTKPT
jgi:hypothetical protein